MAVSLERIASPNLAEVRERRSEGRIRLSLRYSLFDGFFGALTTGLVEAYFVPFGLALRASAAQIGQLAAIPSMVGALAQSHASFLVRQIGGRKPAMRLMVGLQALSLFVLCGILAVPPDIRFTTLLGLVTCYMIFSGLATPLYGSLLADYLPSQRRSGYFGWRNRIIGGVTVGGSFLAGMILHGWGKQSLIGFACLFALAGLCRLISWAYQEFLHEGGLRQERRHKKDRQWLLHRRFSPNFLRFVLFAGLMMGSINLAAPFFPVYLLQELGLSYLMYTLLVIGSQITMYFMMAPWGRQADQIGNLKIVKVVACLMPLIPLLWILSADRFYLFGIQVAAGLLWSGYNLCTTNFIYDAVPAPQRVQAAVVFNIVVGLTSFIGAWMGGQLLTILPMLRGERFYTLALLSAILQGLVLLFLLPLLREVRTVRHMKSADLFYSVLGIRPLWAVLRDGFHAALRDDA